MELRQGYDVKLYGRKRRYMIVRIGPYEEYAVLADEMIVQPRHPTRLRHHGKQIKVKLREIEALCCGMASDQGPIWTRVMEPPASPYPKMPGTVWVKLDPDDGNSYTNDGPYDNEGQNWRTAYDDVP